MKKLILALLVLLPGITLAQGATLGDYSYANGDYSIAIGHGDGIMSFGGTADGDYSTAIGPNSLASGLGALALHGSAYGNFSTAIGEGVGAYSFREFVMGSYPTSYTPASATSWNTSDRLFVIGNGSTSSSRANALTMLKSGATTFSNTITASNFYSVAEQNYTGTITWTATTAPGGTVTKVYRWSQVGDIVKYNFVLNHSIAGTVITKVVLTLPSDMPAPALPTGISGANANIEQIQAKFSSNITAQPVNASGGMLKINSTNTGYILNIPVSSNSYKTVYISGEYRI